MTDFNLNVTFDGVTDVARLPGQGTVSWFGTGRTGMEFYSVYASSPDTLDATANITGSNWRIKTLRLAGDEHTTTIRDLDAGEDRRIDFLELGYNSDVELMSTRVRYMYGWDGDEHRVTLGNEQSGSTFAVNLYATRNFLTTGNAYVQSIGTGGAGTGNGDVISIGAGGAGAVQTWDRHDTVTTSTGFVALVSTDGGNDTVTIGAGGAEAIQTGDGNDTVTTGAGWVGSLRTSSGDDTVNLGSGLGGQILLGSGNDAVTLSEADLGHYAAQIRGNDGVDTVSFANFTVGVTVSLDFSGWQNVGATAAAPEADAVGWFAISSTENLTGSNKGDTLEGNAYANVILGRGGADRIDGLAGNDTLNGGGGNDKLFGGAGRDKLLGGGGRDTLEGGAGNDILRGQAKKDVFVFGANSGTDRVLDYRDNVDKIRIEDHSGKFASLDISTSGGDAIIDHDGGSIVLVGQAGATLTASDFIFA
ncbi:MAG: hypothetical protein CML02_15300 [Pseudooceanicola sp.]|jgi:Ca2+-binding RTX toxin-like protein|nr:hypothetical protein [Pseudooceanicola sp.]